MSKKWGLVCGDFHCGHLVGLTPPEYQHKYVQNSTTKRNKYYRISTAMWREFTKILKILPPLDFAVFNGDLIDGKGKKSGGTELITSDMKEQCDMASSIINKIRREYGKPKMKTILTYGTDYHVSTDGDEWENLVAERCFADKIGAHEWLDVNGLVFDIKHHIGSSQIPHGRHTAISKEALWNELWALYEMQPRADVVLRNHVHYFQFCGDADKYCATVPGLQGMGSKHGAKVCSGLVHWGVMLFEINSKKDWTPHPIIRKIYEQQAKATEI